MNTALEPFTARLRREIKAQRVSERQFALRIGWNPTYLSRVLNEEDYRPEPESIAKIAGGLGIEPSEVESWVPKPYAPGAEPGGNGVEPRRVTFEELLTFIAAQGPDEALQVARFRQLARTNPDAAAKIRSKVARPWAANLGLALDIEEDSRGEDRS
jgi:transcriptional regulator with XRE-family HTH domain